MQDLVTEQKTRFWQKLPDDTPADPNNIDMEMFQSRKIVTAMITINGAVGDRFLLFGSFPLPSKTSKPAISAGLQTMTYWMAPSKLPRPQHQYQDSAKPVKGICACLATAANKSASSRWRQLRQQASRIFPSRWVAGWDTCRYFWDRSRHHCRRSDGHIIAGIAQSVVGGSGQCPLSDAICPDIRGGGGSGCQEHPTDYPR